MKFKAFIKSGNCIDTNKQIIKATDLPKPISEILTNKPEIG